MGNEIVRRSGKRKSSSVCGNKDQTGRKSEDKVIPYGTKASVTRPNFTQQTENKRMSRVPHFCLYAISLTLVCADGDSPPPCADARCRACMACDFSQHRHPRAVIYKETTVRLRKRRCDVLLVSRRVRNNKMFLYEPCSFLLTLDKPSAIGVQLT